MNTAWLALVAGLAAGSVHVLTGPDHLAAVVPLAATARERGEKSGLAIGLLWGLGHGLGVVLLASFGAMLHSLIDLDVASRWTELVVGVALVGLGLWTIQRSRSVVIHTHGHQHESRRRSNPHVHVHIHIGDTTVGTQRHVRAGQHEGHRHGAFAFGLLHGVAGTGHLIAALPALALGGAASLAYVAGYLVAAVPLMALVSGAVVRLISPARITPALRVSGALATFVGLTWIGVGMGWI